MQKIISILILFMVSIFCQAQTPISGVVNVYTKVNAIENCSGKVSVAGASGFQTGMFVMLIQMKGATINTSNDASFGNISHLNNAGKYEINEITNISGNDIFLKNNIINSYDFGGKVQLIGALPYVDVTVTNTLTGQPWNGTTGGVVFLMIQNNLTLEADITTSGIGFRGGATNFGTNNDCSWISNQDDYYYSLGSWRGAQKGEGIADYVSGRESGRGAQANGGGGGNDHNSGGGGGANISAGGKGGDNDEPSTFGCDGYFAGRGGKSLQNANDRIFMGGGGGAGHSNNQVGTDGGNGGGIIVLIANSIAGNSHKIVSNGTSPDETNGDGGGGGGAGGSILINTGTISSALKAETRGGHGGNINNHGQDRCFGPGGGGSGGRIVFVQATPTTIDVGGGAKGVSVNSAASCDVGSQNGNNGISGTIAGIPQGNMEIIAPQITAQTEGTQNICLTETLSLQVSASGADITYQWQENTGSGFHNIADNLNFTGTQSPTLVISNFTSSMQGNQYQCVIISDCFDNAVSTPVSINLLPNPVSAFTFTPIDDSTFTFQNNSTNADDYLWSFGDETTSVEENPTHVFHDSGDFVVSLTSTNGCGSDETTITVHSTTMPTAGFMATVTEGCSPLEVHFDNLSGENGENWFWTFEGGMPATSTAENPVVYFNTAGTFDVTLTVTNQAGSDVHSENGYIHVLPDPRAVFTASVTDMDIMLTNNSTDATSYQWDFGDGNVSEDPAPAHHYEAAGYYTIVLKASSICGDSYTSQEITIGSLPLAQFDWDKNQGCTPFDIQFTNLSSGDPTQVLWSFEGGTPAVSNTPNPVVTYTDAGNFDVTMIVANGLGGDTLHFDNFVTANPSPTVDFSFTASGNTVHFTNLSTNGSLFQWNFGDGSPVSEEQNPVHTFPSDDIYQVMLTVSNSSCGASIARAVWINTTEISDLSKRHILMHPNPTNGLLYLAFQDSPFTGNITVYDETGKKLLEKAIRGQSSTVIDLTQYPKGIYWVKIWNKDVLFIDKVMTTP